MATRTHKIRLGLFVVVSTVLLAVVVIVFGGTRFLQRTDGYRIVFSGSVMGLEPGAQVYLNGIRVGTVEDLRVAPEALDMVEVSIAVARGTPIHTDTRAVLIYAGITGLKNVDLRDGTRASPPLPVGGTIPQGETLLDRISQDTTELAERSRALIARTEQLVENLVELTDPATFEALPEILAQARIAATTLASTGASLEAMIDENRAALRQSLAAMRDAATRASSLVDERVAGLVSGAGELVAELRTVVRGNEGQLRSALFDLRQASRNFKELSRELRQRPSRLLFSRPPRERELP